MSRSPRLAIWIVGLATALWLLHFAGTEDLAAPPAEPTAWASWTDTVGADAAIVALLRVGAIGLCWYLVLATVIGSLVRRVGAPDTVALVDRALPPALRNLLGATAAGLTVSAAGLIATVGPLLAPAALHAVGAAGAVASSDDGVADADVGLAPTVNRRESAPPDPTGESVTPSSATLAPFAFGLAPLDASVPTGPRTPAPVIETWLTQPGDHLWSIAAETLADELGNEPTESQTTQYWLAVIEINRDRLVDQSNPDLILPGQEFVLPPVDTDGRGGAAPIRSTRAPEGVRPPGCRPSPGR